MNIGGGANKAQRRVIKVAKGARHASIKGVACRWSGLLPLLWLCHFSVVRAETTQTLTGLIASLQAQGHRIIYSSELVPEGVAVPAKKSLSGLRELLSERGLILKRMGAIWIITRDDPGRRSVSGYLVDADGDPIQDADISNGSSATIAQSRQDGYFEVRLEPGKQELTIMANGYRPRQILGASLARNPLIVLEEDRIESVIVTGSRYYLPGDDKLVSSLYLSADEMYLVPALGGDSLRVVTRLPGVSSVGVSAKPRVRGGLQDELLILLDGVELLEPFHLADFHSVFSTIDGRTVDSIDFYTGGFPARYGNRMSGVMDVSSAIPVSDSRTELGVSLFSSFVNNRGQIDGQRQAEWLLSARRSNLADLSSATASDLGSPHYVDAFGRFGIAVNERTELGFGAFLIEDDVTLTDDEEKATSAVDTYHLWSRLDFRPNRNGLASLVLSYLHSRRDQTQSVAEEDSNAGPGAPEIEEFLNYRQDLERFTLRNDYRFAFGEHRLEFGWQAEYGHADYDYQGVIDRGIFGELFGMEEHSVRETHLNPSGWSGGLYLTGQLMLTPKLWLQPGIRWDFQNYYVNGSAENSSPRLGFYYRVSDDLDLRASIGRFYQPEGLQELQVLDGRENYFRPQRSDQAIVNVEWQAGNRVRFKAEAYYKDYRELKARYENLFNTFVLQPHMEPDRVAIISDKARVSGLELGAAFDLSSRVSADLRYYYLDARDRIGNRWVPRRWSQRHTVNGGLSWQRDTLVLTANLTWHTGWWATALPESLPSGSVLAPEQVLNNKELRDYWSLDLSLRKSWRFNDAELTLSADITNVFGRNNISGAEYDVEEQQNRLVFIANEKRLLPLAPSVGLMLTF